MSGMAQAAERSLTVTVGAELLAHGSFAARLVPG